MFRRGQHLFVSMGGGVANSLEPVVAAPSQDDLTELCLVDEDSVVDPAIEGESAVLYFSSAGRFMQQFARIVEATEGGRSIIIEAMSEPVCGESRQCYRVCTVLMDYSAAVGSEDLCRIMNVSATGLAVVSQERFGLGATAPVSFELGRKMYSGECLVQSARPVRGGWRYGLFCASVRGSGNLGNGLHKLAAEAQRIQLRRLSGAA